MTGIPALRPLGWEACVGVFGLPFVLARVLFCPCIEEDLVHVPILTVGARIQLVLVDSISSAQIVDGTIRLPCPGTSSPRMWLRHSEHHGCGREDSILIVLAN